MRRKQGSLVPTELAILEAGVDLHASGTTEFHGYLLARHMRDASGARKLLGHGTLYKAFDRMEAAGMLESRWEDPTTAAAENRPRRRLYRVTAFGRGVLAAQAVMAKETLRLEPEVT